MHSMFLNQSSRSHALRSIETRTQSRQSHSSDKGDCSYRTRTANWTTLIVPKNLLHNSQLQYQSSAENHRYTAKED
jgi:hypothetical protein